MERPAMSRFAALACLILLAVTDVAEPEIIQPYLQSLTDSTVVVCWQTRASRTGKVVCGLTSSWGKEVSQPGYAVDHEITLFDLQMDTLYHYRVVSGTDTSADATFHTNVTGNRPFRFFAYGDNRSDRAAHQRVVNRMLATSPMPNLALNVGDLTNQGSGSDYRKFFGIEHEIVRRLPVYPSPGNHDVHDMTNWIRFFALPNNERWYTVRYGNSVFHCLDSYSDHAPGSSQYDWLVSELRADSAEPSVRHIFVWFHEPPYTTNAAHPGNTTARQHLCPLFERFHVAIVFLGHIHAYEHSIINGVHYIISGGGGAPLHTRWNAAQPWTAYREATYEAVVVDVNGDTIRSVGVRPDGSEFDTLLLVRHAAAAERR
jgi:acid phosphatase type 7